MATEKWKQTGRIQSSLPTGMQQAISSLLRRVYRAMTKVFHESVEVTSAMLKKSYRESLRCAIHEWIIEAYPGYDLYAISYF